MQPYLSVAVHESQRSTVLSLDGELDLASAGALEDVIRRLQPTDTGVVVDVEKLRFIDMAGLRVLIAARERANREGWRLVLSNVHEPVRRVLSLAQVGDLLLD